MNARTICIYSTVLKGAFRIKHQRGSIKCNHKKGLNEAFFAQLYFDLRLIGLFKPLVNKLLNFVLHLRIVQMIKLF